MVALTPKGSSPIKTAPGGTPTSPSLRAQWSLWSHLVARPHHCRSYRAWAAKGLLVRFPGFQRQSAREVKAWIIRRLEEFREAGLTAGAASTPQEVFLPRNWRAGLRAEATFPTQHLVDTSAHITRGDRSLGTQPLITVMQQIRMRTGPRISSVLTVYIKAWPAV